MIIVNIENMKAGYILDSEVVKHLNFKGKDDIVSYTGKSWFDYHHDLGLFQFSSKIQDAWTVVYKMQTWGGCTIDCLSSSNGTEWYEVTTIKEGKTYKYTAHTAPEAICKCFLLAMADNNEINGH